MNAHISADNVKLKRAYEPAAADDGMRVLIDRLWPRGVSKDHAALDLWLKDLAPSTELRKWFDHDPAASFSAVMPRRCARILSSSSSCTIWRRRVASRSSIQLTTKRTTMPSCC